MSDLVAFREAFHASALSVSLRVRYNNFTPPQTPWQNLQAPPGKNLLACMLEVSIAFTASGSSTVVASTDLLDEWLQGIEFSSVAGGGPDRIQTKTRIGSEELERLVLDSSEQYTPGGGWNGETSHLGSYPRSAPAGFTASGTRTDTSEYWIPLGGPAGSLRINMAPTSTTWTTPANISAVYTIGFFEVWSLYSGVVAAYQNKTATLAISNYLDLIAEKVVPPNLAVDIVSFLAQTTTNVTQLMVNDQLGIPVIKMDTTQSINATQYVYPQFATTAPAYNALVFFLNKTVPTTFQVSLANSVALDILFIQVQGPNVNPANDPQATASPPATGNVGTPLPGVGPTSSATSSARSSSAQGGKGSGGKFSGYPGR